MRWLKWPCVPGQHGVVVGDDRARRPLGSELFAVDPAEARDDAVGGGGCFQIGDRAPASLRGDGEAAVLDQQAVVGEVGNVLSRGAHSTVVTTGDGLRPVLVEQLGTPLEKRGQIGTDLVEVDLLLCGRGCVAGVGGIEQDHGVACCHDVARFDADVLDASAVFCVKRMMHLHCFDDGEHRTGGHGLSRRDVDRDHRARHRRADLDRHAMTPATSSSASSVRIGEQPASILTVARSSPRVGPRLTIATGMPRAAACRTNR